MTNACGGHQAKAKAKPSPSSSNGKPSGAAKPAAAASTGNGKPREHAQGASTPEDIQERRKEVQGWIKEWRNRCRTPSAVQSAMRTRMMIV